MEKQNLTVRFSPELLEALRTVAAGEGVSVAALIREAANGLVLQRMLGVR
jgi:predicted HicB family RNase H-like nuclease